MGQNPDDDIDAECVAGSGVVIEIGLVVPSRSQLSDTSEFKLTSTIKRLLPPNIA